MRKRIWLIGLVAVIAAAIGLGSATAFAQEKEEGSSRTGLIARGRHDPGTRGAASTGCLRRGAARDDG